MEQQLYYGVDSMKSFRNLLLEIKPKKVFLVRGKKSYELCGAKHIIEDTLSNLECDTLEYFDFEENPDLKDVEKGLEILNKFNPNIIVAIGGGSVIDMAKLIRFFYSYQGNPIENKFSKAKEIIPLVAIPTTAGTGAETTHFAVMYKNKIKYSVAHENILPEYAIVYPPFTYNNSKYLTACTGFDALSQAIEAYWNKNATLESDNYAVRAIELIYKNLFFVVNYPTEELRDKLSEGSYFAGRAINITKTTAPHAFSYPFTTHYNYPHGHAVALTFPFFLAYNYGNDCNSMHKAKMNKLYNILDIKNVEAAESEFIRYIKNIGLGLKQEEISLNKIFENVNLERLSNNPIVVDKSIAGKIALSLKQL